jgi:RND family efflux transporter MFP subunit
LLQTTGDALAVAQVPASFIARSNRAEPEVRLVLDAAPDSPVAARFASAATEADENTQTFEVKFAFAPPSDVRILPGMTGALRAVFQADDGDALTVPLAAIVSDGEARYVWAVDTETMKVSRRDIGIAPGVGGALTVTSGLAAGDTIVGAGASYLHEGMQIRPYQR